MSRLYSNTISSHENSKIQQSHSFGRPNFNRNNNNPKNNSTKFQRTPGSKSKPATSIMTEIDKWIDNNNDRDIRFVSYKDNIVTITMTYGKEHTIEITCPKAYPEYKKGFSCREVQCSGKLALGFIPRANEQLENKALSFERVITHLTNTFAKYKQVKKLGSNQNSGSSVIFQTSFSSNESDPWTNAANENITTPETISPTGSVNNEIDTNDDDIEMVNLEHSISVSDNILDNPDIGSFVDKSNSDDHQMRILQDIDLINKILGESDNDNNVTTEMHKDTTTQQTSDSWQEICNTLAYNTLNTLMENYSQSDQNNLDPNLTVSEGSAVSAVDKEESSNSNTEFHEPLTDTLSQGIGDCINEMSSNTQLGEEVHQVQDIQQGHQVQDIQQAEAVEDNKTNEVSNVSNKSLPEDELDDRPINDEIFDFDTEIVVVKKNTRINDNILKQKNIQSISGNYDEFVTQTFKELDRKYPNLEEDKIMNIIQKKWKILLKNCGKTNSDKFTMETNNTVEKEPFAVKKSQYAPGNDSDEESDEDIIEDSQPPNSIKSDINEDINEDIIEDGSQPNSIKSDIVEECVEEKIPVSKNILPPLKMGDSCGDSHEDSCEDSHEDSHEDSCGEAKVPVKKTNMESSDEEEESLEKEKITITSKGKYKGNKVAIKAPIKTAHKTQKKSESNNACQKNNSDSRDEHLIFSDVNDGMGLYLDLSSYIKVKKLPFDMDKLYENAQKIQEEMDFGNSSKIKKSFSSSGAIRVVMNEFKHLFFLGVRNFYTVEPINNNVYYLKLIFSKDFFDKSSKIYADLDLHNKKIEISIRFDSKLYPFYPPKLQLLNPRLNNHMNSRIATMECLLLSRWNPNQNIEVVISYLRDLINQYGEIDLSGNNYDELENDLIELSLLSEIPARINSFLTIEQLKNIKEYTQNIGTDINKGKNRWTKGTGYGHEGLAAWDYRSTQNAKEERDKQLSKCIKDITKHLTKIIINNIQIDPVDILINSCYIPYMKSIFWGNNILELLKNPAQFESLLNSMRIMNSKFAPIYIVKDSENESSLYDIFSEFNDDCKMYLNTMENSSKDQSLDAKTEIDLISNFVSFFRKIQRDINKLKLEEDEKNIKVQLSEKIKTEREIYKTALADEMFKEFPEMNLDHFEKLVKMAGEAKTTTLLNTQASRRIAKELLSHKKNMPHEFESSIFYRFNPNNLKYHEFVIAGPQGTPYDSGCFHFRMYCSADYPNKNPKVNIYTTANGSFAFNPNLYANGTVCLSILGTYSAQASESWMPETSTMMQIMISIQSIVMNPDPYFNEPGFEKGYNTEEGKIKSVKYNHPVRLNCMKWAMVDAIRKPVPGFENAILTHFKLKEQYIRDTCAVWVSEAPDNLEKEFKNVYKNLCEELDKLTGKFGKQEEQIPTTSSLKKTIRKKNIKDNLVVV